MSLRKREENMNIGLLEVIKILLELGEEKIQEKFQIESIPYIKLSFMIQ